MHQERCPFVPLPPSWEEYAGSLGKSLRKNIGYYRRLMEREHRFEIETVTNGALPEAMEEFFELHQARWRRRRRQRAWCRTKNSSSASGRLLLVRVSISKACSRSISRR